MHPELADTFEAVAKRGKDGFYTGRVAEGTHFLAYLHAI